MQSFSSTHYSPLLTLSDPVQVTPVRKSVVRASVDFLQSHIMQEAAYGDRNSAMALAGVLEVLHGITRPTDMLRRRAESEAYDYIASYTDLLVEAGAPPDVLIGLHHVAQVLAATDIARKEEHQTGQLCSYARVEDIYESFYTTDRR